VQYVSSTPATRLDVINLQEQLDQRLLQRQARETGICPVREELYAQCFDELIRQVTINCAERGLLLLRVRDEIRMTIAAYQTLYESSIAFGMRKALQAEQGKADMERVKVLIHAFREHNGLQHREFDSDISFAWLPLYTHFDRTEEIELQMYYGVMKRYDRIMQLRSADYMRQRNPTNKRIKKHDTRADDPFAGEEPPHQAEHSFGDVGTVSSDNPQDGV
jgi:hypothetical protein